MFAITGLKISGFKSFADRTNIPIEKGLTGIVGPNGCGKSNILEALRWVMGETSAKQLRGSSMDDVIFAGTQVRAQSNIASVSILAELAPNAILPFAGFDNQTQIEITRRMERNKGSRWTVNHQQMRAKDIRLLFADASSGSRSASIVSQGQITQIIQQEGTAIRGLIEDAAGISGLTPRRTEALQRLERTRANLIEIDHLLELEQTKLTNYQKDVRQLQKYKELSLQIEELERLYFGLSLYQALKNYQATQELLQRQTARKQALSHKIISINKEATSIEAEKISLKRQEVKIFDQIQSQETSLAQLIQQQQQYKNDIQNNQQQQNIISNDLADFEKQALSQKEKHKQNLLKFENNQHIIKDYQQKTKDLEQELQSRNNQLNVIANDYDIVKEQYQKWQGQMETLKALQMQYQEQIKRYQQKQVQLKQQKIETKDFDHLILEQNNVVTETKQEIQNFLDQLHEKKQKLQKQQSLVEQLNQEQHQYKLQKESLVTEQQSLHRLLKNHQTTDNQILDILTIPKQWIHPILAALQAKARLPLLKHDDKQSYWRKDFASTEQQTTTAWQDLTCLAEVMDNIPTWLKPLLRQGFIVTSDAFAFEHQYALKPGQYFVSMSGKMWNWDGTIYPNFDAGAAEILLQRQRLSELDQKLQILEHKHQAIKEEYTQQQQKFNDAKQELQQYDIKIKQAEHRQQQAQKLQISLSAQKQVQEAKIEAYNVQEQTLKADIEEVQKHLDQTEAQLKLHQETKEPPLAKAKADYENIKQAFEQSQHQMQQYEKELMRLTQENSHLTNLLSHLGDEIKQHDKQKEILQKRLQQLVQEYDSLQKQKTSNINQDQIKEQITQAKQTYRETQKKHEELLLYMQKLDYQLKEAQKQREGLVQNLDELDQQAELHKQHMQNMKVKIEQHFDLSGEQLLEMLTPKQKQESYDLRKLENEIIHCKGKREGLGQIDFDAAKNLQQQQNKIDDIIRNQADLTQALEKLEKAINTLDKEAREKLTAAFEQVSMHFERIFKLLFGGGSCHLTWIGSSDPLQAGVAVMASPPNKKLQLLSLLSGGEQTLTATALLFAVFSCKPSPICVLDEIDAPLDDHNVQRLCALLDSMSKQLNTRFLIITHHRITMAKMERLFGITMMQQGVSRLVSVSLKQAESISEK